MFFNSLLSIRNAFSSWVRHIMQDRQTKWISVKPLKTGQLRISQAAIQDIIRHSTVGIRGLGKLNSSIIQKEEGLEISIYCHIDDGYDISLISQNIRHKVSNPVERFTGIRVIEVKVKRNEQLLGKNRRKTT